MALQKQEIIAEDGCILKPPWSEKMTLPDDTKGPKDHTNTSPKSF